MKPRLDSDSVIFMISTERFFPSILVVFLLLIIVAVPGEARQYKEVSSSSGFDYRAVENSEEPPLAPDLINNAGIYVADVTNNLWPDILAIGGDQPRIYVNEKGDFRRNRSLPDVERKINAAAFVDYNRDGWKDLVLVPQNGRLILLRNVEGRFTRDRVLSAPNLEAGIGISVGDYNQDSCPDLMVLQFNDLKSHQFSQRKYLRLGRERDKVKDNGLRNYLLKGTCEGFVLAEDLVFDRPHWSLAASFVDVNGDRFQDIYVTNDYYRDSLYLNQGNGNFEHTYLPDYTDRNGMSSQLLDVNHDGRPDQFISNIFMDVESEIYSERHRFSDEKTRGHNLLVNSGSGPEWFVDSAEDSNVQKAGWGWAVTSTDYDNDFEFELLQARQNFLARNKAYQWYNLNNYKIAKFVGKYHGNTPVPQKDRRDNRIYDLFEEWLGYPGIWDWDGSKFKPLEAPPMGFERMDARGIVELDFNRDGGMDIGISQYEGPFRLFKNTKRLNKPGTSWIKFDVQEAFQGGHIMVQSEGLKRFIPLSSRTDFLSQETPFFHIGLPNTESVTRVLVRWNDGSRQVYEDVEPGQVLTVSKP